ncbi:EamA family transporter [Catenulispora sp. NL8]|uniref:EamA family transporter n=1 Tax=Catenulispora pinistramenti TaxID=2705254 RepID=A0ABS5KH43_9ACTN|nr:EamA family transporter [Catenulispora pinistramenti]MBS2545589.1 EamA family transporter [Catenulispora pinistramenti]
MSLLSAEASAAGAPGILVPVVLSAAFLHACWNAILKFVPDKLTASLLMTVSGGVLAGLGAFVVPVPARASWVLLLVSAALHVGYFLMLIKTFEIGDFNQVYPLARGLSPVVVAGFATLLGDPMSRHQTLGIAVVCGGLATLVFSAGRPKRTQGKALFWAAMTGLSIATYTVTDGVAVRHSGTAAGYTAWMMLAESTMMTAACVTIMVRRGAAAPGGQDAGLRAALRQLSRGDVVRAVIAGALSLLAYGLVLWAQTRGALAAVSALRETSVIFGAALGSVFLREPFGRYRILAAVTIASGILILEAA